MAEDEVNRASEQLQKTTDGAIREADAIGQTKETEMLEV